MKQALEAHKACSQLMSVTETMRRRAIHSIADALDKNVDQILKENSLDQLEAKRNTLSMAIIDRLTLTKEMIHAMAHSCREIAHFPQVVGGIVQESKRSDGLIIQKQRIPIGVIAMIFESRPNVVIDGAALAIKSGNAILLKGGKEAHHSNKVLADIVHQAISGIIPNECIQLVETREDVQEMLKLNHLIDLVVPRGGESLIKFVKANATMPVVAHDRGLCHIYLHSDADEKSALSIVLNAKTQRPGVCNAMETLLVHKDFQMDILVNILKELQDKKVEIHACEKSDQLIPGLIKATDQDFDCEWLDLKMSLKIVENESEAIKHIQKYGTHHTEAVLTQSPQVIEAFLQGIDASCLAINASTRFNDGGELGLGAELGISTSKLHAYGAMGAQEMTTTRFIVRGTGHIRS